MLFTVSTSVLPLFKNKLEKKTKVFEFIGGICEHKTKIFDLLNRPKWRLIPIEKSSIYKEIFAIYLIWPICIRYVVLFRCVLTKFCRFFFPTRKNNSRLSECANWSVNSNFYKVFNTVSERTFYVKLFLNHSL